MPEPHLINQTDSLGEGPRYYHKQASSKPLPGGFQHTAEFENQCWSVVLKVWSLGHCLEAEGSILPSSAPAHTFSKSEGLGWPGLLC
jgi:hypothetical protein